MRYSTPFEINGKMHVMDFEPNALPKREPPKTVVLSEDNGWFDFNNMPTFGEAITKLLNERAEQAGATIARAFDHYVPGFSGWTEEEQIEFGKSNYDEYTIVYHPSTYDEKTMTVKQNIEVLNDADYFARFGHHIKDVQHGTYTDED